MTTVLVPISLEQFSCKCCDYTTIRKSQFERHLLTAKHINTTNTTNLVQQSSNSFICECGKEYKHHSSLWNHKKKCNITIVTDSNAESFDKDKLILMLINQNAELIKETSEFKNIMLEQQNMMMAQHTSTQNIMIAQNTSTQNMMMDVITPLDI